MSCRMPQLVFIPTALCGVGSAIGSGSSTIQYHQSSSWAQLSLRVFHNPIKYFNTESAHHLELLHWLSAEQSADKYNIFLAPMDLCKTKSIVKYNTGCNTQIHNTRKDHTCPIQAACKHIKWRRINIHLAWHLHCPCKTGTTPIPNQMTIVIFH